MGTCCLQDVRVPTSPHDTTWTPLTHGCHLAAPGNHWLFLTTHYPALLDQALGFVCLKQSELTLNDSAPSVICFCYVVRSLHSFTQHTIYWMPVLCWGHRWPGQSPVLPSELTLPWADLIYQASNCRVSDPPHKQRCIYSYPWCHSPGHLSALTLSLDLPQITPSLKGCLAQWKGWQSWDRLGDLG